MLLHRKKMSKVKLRARIFFYNEYSELLDTLEKTEPNQKREFKFCREENTIRRASATRTYPTSEIDTEVVPDDQDSYDEDSFDSATTSSTKSVEEELEFCDLAAPSTLDCKDDVVEKSSLDGLFNLLEQVLIADKFQEIISCLEEILFRARIEEQLVSLFQSFEIQVLFSSKSRTTIKSVWSCSASPTPAKESFSLLARSLRKSP